MKTRTWLALACASALATPALAQDHSNHDGQDMNGMQDMPGMEMPTPQQPTQPAEPMKHDHMTMGHDHAAMHHDGPGEGSGTSRLPGNDGGIHAHGLHIPAGDWTLMVHGNVSAQYTKDTGPRGDDKLYSTSMLMLIAQHETSWGRIQLKSMMSLEPLMDQSGYPNLFTTGETAHGQPLVDRQHPHDLFMELSGRIDVNAGSGSLFLYGGPVGEPALGPSAFMHRASAKYNPEPPITHHWFDSTHITYGVVTAGYAGKAFQIEASAFRGAEPDEHRWNIETPKLDSWSVRATLNPSHALAIQASYGELTQPEATHPGENEHRFTTSAHYSNGKGLSAMLGYSAKKRVPGETLSAWLGEANWDLDSHNTVFGRVENVANDELFPDHSHPLHDVKFRVTKFQLGYARRIPLGPVELALGGSAAAFAKPAALDPYYGKDPMGYTLFARLNLGH